MFTDNSVSEALRQRTIFTGRNLRSQKAPTQLGYNDAALMIAYASTGYEPPRVSGEHISRFLRGNYSAPEDARAMSVEVAADYLAKLHEEGLIEGQGFSGTHFSMSGGFARLLQADMEAIRSPQISELLFRGFDIFMHPWNARNLGLRSHRSY